LQRSPDPLAGLRGPTSKGRGGRDREEGGKGNAPLYEIRTTPLDRETSQKEDVTGKSRVYV